jgi:arylesterase/paraoxonase
VKGNTRFLGFLLTIPHPILVKFGLGRAIIENIGNKDGYIAVPELSACKSASFVQSCFLNNLKCSRNRSSPTGLPLGWLNVIRASRTDYVASYDPKTSCITHLNVAN